MSFLGEDIKKLGFGLMRLPKQGEVIDLKQTKAMVDAFLDAGFTYFDTAWAYPGSEDAVPAMLTTGREKRGWRNCPALAEPSTRTAGLRAAWSLIP